MKPHHSVYKLYSEQVTPSGFTRLKTAWWERKTGVLLQRIHLHKFTFTTSFRVHTAIHLEGFGVDSDWLNGIYSHDGWFERRILGLPLRRYSFDFTESPGSWEPCARNLSDFTRDILIPWFDQWADVPHLQTNPKSPLQDEQKAYLASACRAVIQRRD